MVFDKTGTLTVGMPVFQQVVLFGDGVDEHVTHTNGAVANGTSKLDQHDLLRLAGSVEQLSTRLLGRTLATAASADFSVG